jgi:hypothetical protein
MGDSRNLPLRATKGEYVNASVVLAGQPKLMVEGMGNVGDMEWW